MFDSRQYEWADITVVLAGRDVTGIRGISYTESPDREPLFAKGRYAQAIQTGNISYTGEIRLLQSELEGLIKAGGGSLINLNVDIVICYGDYSKGDAITIDTVKGVRFGDLQKSINQGDKFMEVTLPFWALSVEFQVV